MSEKPYNLDQPNDPEALQLISKYSDRTSYYKYHNDEILLLNENGLLVTEVGDYIRPNPSDVLDIKIYLEALNITAWVD